MKTLTEFDGFRLKNALQTKKELTAAGKTAEELPQAMGEALKLEGDKLTHLLAALELAEGHPEHLKRVVVYTVEEGQKAPNGAVQKGDKWYLAEFFYTPAPKRKAREEHADGRRGRGKGRDKGKRRRPDRNERSDSGDRGARARSDARSDERRPSGPAMPIGPITVTPVNGKPITVIPVKVSAPSNDGKDAAPASGNPADSAKAGEPGEKRRRRRPRHRRPPGPRPEPGAKAAEPGAAPNVKPLVTPLVTPKADNVSSSQAEPKPTAESTADTGGGDQAQT